LPEAGLAKSSSFYSSREEADEALRDVLTDEPEWEDELGIVAIELG
jgi:hypothetical protein